MTQRTERVSSVLRKAIQEVIAKGLNDPRIRGLITVVDVTVSQDLKSATVAVSIFPEEHEKLTMHGLESSARHIRRKAGDLVALQVMPDLRFKLDRSLKAQADVFSALSKVAEERDANHTTDQEQSAPQEDPDT